MHHPQAPRDELDDYFAGPDLPNQLGGGFVDADEDDADFDAAAAAADDGAAEEDGGEQPVEYADDEEEGQGDEGEQQQQQAGGKQDAQSRRLALQQLAKRVRRRCAHCVVCLPVLAWRWALLWPQPR
jgi:hypothetical protein